MENKMFCYQCQETAGCTGCTKFGVCGKSPELARLQDLLIYTTKGLSEVTTRLREEGKTVDTSVNHLITINLFTTITNANFDDAIFYARIKETLATKETLLAELNNKENLSEAALWNATTEAEMDQKVSFLERIKNSFSKNKEEAVDINKILDDNNLSLDDIDYIVPHQANIRIIDYAAKKLKSECEKLKKEQDSLSFKEQIEKKIAEVKELMAEEEYMNAKVKLGYIIEELDGKSEYIDKLKECNELLKTCNDKLDEISAKKEESSKKEDNNTSNDNDEDQGFDSSKIDFNDELKKQIATAGETYVEFYFEYGSDTAPSKFAEKAYEDTENDTPLGQYKEQGKTIFMNAFKQAFEATGNEYY